MNHGLHRVIFNAARGVRMVVAETASGAGKGNSSGSGSGNGATTATGSGSTSGWRAAVFGIGWTALAAMSMLAYAAGAHAQIVPNPFAAAGQKPQVLVAPNGVPLVNITTPSAGGVSINQYRQFDINAAGAILNNSRTTASTQLGGLVQGNPWLATGPARIIVNQVSSSNPSYLNGYVEVAGQRAEVIIANPSGISVNGGGFINTSRATLTTGTPQYGAMGTLDSFLVQGGTVTIQGNGLDLSTTDYAANHNIGRRFLRDADRGTEGQTLHYSVPYGWWLLGFTASNSQYFQTVAGLYEGYVYAGKTNNAELKLTDALPGGGHRWHPLRLQQYEAE